MKRHMNKISRSIIIIAIILTTMLIIPLITVNTVKSDAGMLVTMVLFFIIHPSVSVAVGILAGKDIKWFWFSPILVAGLFYVFSYFTYKTAFPILYSVSYFVICAISMFITWLMNRKNYKI